MSTEQQDQFDISVVVTAHAEGRLAHRTMRSVQAAMEEAAKQGLRTEIIVVLDNPTAETLAYFARWREAAQVLDVSHRDPGLSRNSAVGVARGKYVAIVDADDLFGRDWLRLAYRRAEACPLDDFIVHAEYSIFFENWSAIWHHVASHSPGFRKSLLVHACYWTSVLFAPRSTFEKIPFLSTTVDTGFGYEDWHWMCEVLGAGGEVVIAPETCKFTRYKSSGSQLASYDRRSALIRPTKLFDPRRVIDAGSGGASGNSSAGQNPHAAASAPAATTLTMRERLRSVPRYISKVTESHPPLQRALGAVYRTLVAKPDLAASLPAWLMRQWHEITEIEPELFPDHELLTHLEIFDPDPKVDVATYEQLCQVVGTYHRDVDGPPFTHVYLVPRLKRGGTDLETLNYILLTASDSANRILVIATDELESPWKSRLPESAAFLNFFEIGSSLQREKQKKLLARLLVQLQPQVIHNIYSRLGNQVYVAYGRALSRLAHLYAPAFCLETEPNGKPVGEIITYLPAHAEHLTGVLSDNRDILDYLEAKFALDPAKLFVHYQPMTMKPLPEPRQLKPGDEFHVLWAGRLDRQKRPDLMLEIARRCQADNIHFHVYGSTVVVRDQAKVDFSAAPNVTYHGEFDGLRSLPTDHYDVFLNTSQWEGMPNILLEAVSVGLPIVASDVGGVRELIVQDQTGILVTPFDDVEQYVVGLRRLKADNKLRQRLTEASRKLLAERHSWAHFTTEMNGLPGYFKRPVEFERAELSLLEKPSLKDPLEASPAVGRT